MRYTTIRAIEKLKIKFLDSDQTRKRTAPTKGRTALSFRSEASHSENLKLKFRILIRPESAPRPRRGAPRFRSDQKYLSMRLNQCMHCPTRKRAAPHVGRAAPAADPKTLIR